MESLCLVDQFDPLRKDGRGPGGGVLVVDAGAARLLLAMQAIASMGGTDALLGIALLDGGHDCLLAVNKAARNIGRGPGIRLRLRALGVFGRREGLLVVSKALASSLVLKAGDKGALGHRYSVGHDAEEGDKGFVRMILRQLEGVRLDGLEVPGEGKDGVDGGGSHRVDMALKHVGHGENPAVDTLQGRRGRDLAVLAELDVGEEKGKVTVKTEAQRVAGGVPIHGVHHEGCLVDMAPVGDEGQEGRRIENVSVKNHIRVHLGEVGGVLAA